MAAVTVNAYPCGGPHRRQEKLAAKREEEMRSSPGSRGDTPSTAHASPASSPSMSASKPPQVEHASQWNVLALCNRVKADRACHVVRSDGRARGQFCSGVSDTV